MSAESRTSLQLRAKLPAKLRCNARLKIKDPVMSYHHVERAAADAILTKHLDGTLRDLLDRKISTLRRAPRNTHKNCRIPVIIEKEMLGPIAGFSRRVQEHLLAEAITIIFTNHFLPAVERIAKGSTEDRKPTPTQIDFGF